MAQAEDSTTGWVWTRQGVWFWGYDVQQGSIAGTGAGQGGAAKCAYSTDTEVGVQVDASTLGVVGARQGLT